MSAILTRGGVAGRKRGRMALFKNQLFSHSTTEVSSKVRRDTYLESFLPQEGYWAHILLNVSTSNIDDGVSAQ